MTVPGGPAWRQTTYYPYLFASRYGRGTSYQLSIDSPSYATDFAEKVPYLDVSAVESDTDGALTLFIVNRHQTDAITLDVALEGFGDRKVTMDKVIAGHELKAVNGPDRQPVAPADGNGMTVEEGRLKGEIAPLSYRMIRLGR